MTFTQVPCRIAKSDVIVGGIRGCSTASFQLFNTYGLIAMNGRLWVISCCVRPYLQAQHVSQNETPASSFILQGRSTLSSCYEAGEHGPRVANCRHWLNEVLQRNPAFEQQMCTFWRFKLANPESHLCRIAKALETPGCGIGPVVAKCSSAEPL